MIEISEMDREWARMLDEYSLRCTGWYRNEEQNERARAWWAQAQGRMA